MSRSETREFGSKLRGLTTILQTVSSWLDTDGENGEALVSSISIAIPLAIELREPTSTITILAIEHVRSSFECFLADPNFSHYKKFVRSVGALESILKSAIETCDDCIWPLLADAAKLQSPSRKTVAARTLGILKTYELKTWSDVKRAVLSGSWKNTRNFGQKMHDWLVDFAKQHGVRLPRFVDVP